MNRPILLSLTTLPCLLSGHVSAQTDRLKPGFDKAEYIEMLKVAGGFVDTVTIGSPATCRRVYRYAHRGTGQ